MLGVPRRRQRDCRDSSAFLRYGRNITSQGGEDGILEKIFDHLCINRSDDDGGDDGGHNDTPYCVDIGAWDGKHLSNTYNLIHHMGWGGMLIEANRSRYEDLCCLYHDNPLVLCLHEAVDIAVGKEHSLLNILKRNSIRPDFDFLCIDIDGADYHMWHSLSPHYRPRVVCIEFNPTIPNHVYYVQQRDIGIHEGSSLLAIAELGITLGYQLIVTTTFNAIFVRNDLMSSIPQSLSNDASTASGISSDKTQLLSYLDALHNESMVTDIFQTYSGELKLCGPKKLLWHRVSINCQQIQPIRCQRDRTYPFAPPHIEVATVLEDSVLQLSSIISSIVSDHHHHHHSTDHDGMGIDGRPQSQSTTDGIDLQLHVKSILDQCREVFGIGGSYTTTTITTTTQEESKPLLGIHRDTILHVTFILIIAMQRVRVQARRASTALGHDSYAGGGSGLTHDDDDDDGSLRECLALCSRCMEDIGDKLYSSGSSCEGIRRTSRDMSYAMSEAKDWYKRAFYASMHHMNDDDGCCLIPSRLAYKISQSCHRSSKGIDQPSTIPCCPETFDGVVEGLFWLYLSDSMMVMVDQDGNARSSPDYTDTTGTIRSDDDDDDDDVIKQGGSASSDGSINYSDRVDSTRSTMMNDNVPTTLTMRKDLLSLRMKWIHRVMKKNEEGIVDNEMLLLLGHSSSIIDLVSSSRSSVHHPHPYANVSLSDALISLSGLTYANHIDANLLVHVDHTRDGQCSFSSSSTTTTATTTQSPLQLLVALRRAECKVKELLLRYSSVSAAIAKETDSSNTLATVVVNSSRSPSSKEGLSISSDSIDTTTLNTTTTTTTTTTTLLVVFLCGTVVGSIIVTTLFALTPPSHACMHVWHDYTCG